MSAMSIASTAVNFGPLAAGGAAAAVGGVETCAGGFVAAGGLERNDDGGPTKLRIESSSGVSFGVGLELSTEERSDFSFGGSIFSGSIATVGPSAGVCSLR